MSLDVVVELLKQREDWPRAYTVEGALPDDARLVEMLPFADLDGVLAVWLASDEWEGEGELREPRVTVHLLDPVKMAQSLRDA